MEQAVDFIEEFFIDKKSRKSNGIEDEEQLGKRLLEIKKELDSTGSYTLTCEELSFGAKTAWRNASRCIGRIQWRNLDLFDARHVKSTQEMFECLCNHMKRAINGGNIRSCITIFPQRVSGREDFRLWNHQLFAFAGLFYVYCLLPTIYNFIIYQVTLRLMGQLLETLLEFLLLVSARDLDGKGNRPRSTFFLSYSLLRERKEDPSGMKSQMNSKL